jgi:hypothetical protein
MFNIEMNLSVMIFAERMKQIREKLQIKQRKFVAVWSIDTFMYSKIMYGERFTKQKIFIIVQFLKIEENILVVQFADKIATFISKRKVYKTNIQNGITNFF